MNIVRATRPENVVCEQQARFVQNRFLSVETSLSDLCSIFSLFSRKAAGLRDASDKVADTLMSYAEAETINKSLKTGFSELGKTLNVLGDFRELEVQRLNKNVVEVFSQYDEICRRAKEELRVILNARDKDLSHQRHLDRHIERNPHNRQHITKTETELTRAICEISRSQKAIEEQIDLFEKRKLKDIKTAILDFIKIELVLHTKAVELYTEAYNDISDINEAQDLEELKNALTTDSARYNANKGTSFRNSSLQSIANLFSTPQKFQKKDSSSIQTLSSKDLMDESGVDTNESAVETRIVSLRDESDQDEISSPFRTSMSQRHNFHK